MRRWTSKLWRLWHNPGTTKGRGTPARRAARRLELEALEGRSLPSVTPATAVLSGTVFVDTNGNGTREAGEIALPGVQVTLSGPVNASARTDAAGVFSFFNLPAGTYSLSRAPLGEFVAGQDAAGNLGGAAGAGAVSGITVRPGQAGLNYDFAVRGLAPQAISLRQFLNGTTTLFNFLPAPGAAAFVDGSTLTLNPAGTGSLAGSVGQAGVQVALTGVTQLGHAVFRTVTSGPGGAYSFTGLAEGIYALNLNDPTPGFRAGTPTVGSAGGEVAGNTQLAEIRLGDGAAGAGYNFNLLAVTAGANPLGLTAAPANDAGTSTADGLTFDPTVAGRVNGPLVSFQARLDGGGFVSVLGSLRPDRRFVLNAATLAQLGPLGPGAHTLDLVAQNAAGQVAAVSLPFILDTGAPTLTLDQAFTAGLGDVIHTTAATFTVGGTSDGTVQLLPTALLPTVASGTFSFANVPLNPGANDFVLVATDAAGNRTERAFTVVRNQAPTVANPVAAIAVNQNAANRVIDLAGVFADADLGRSIIRLNTNHGAVQVQLYDAAAPRTVANFFNYATDGDYDNALFHRSDPGFVLQGGGFEFVPGSPATIVGIASDGTVDNEFDGVNRSNLRGTVAMAKVGPAPNQPPTPQTINSATNQWFFNLGDNSANLNNQNGGFTVFGEVVDGGDQRVVDALARIPTQDRSLFNSAFTDLPLQNFSGTFPGNATAANFALTQSITVLHRTDELTYAVANNTNPGLVAATVTDNRLVLDFAASGTGTAQVTVTATDRSGASVSTTLQITVS